MKKRKPSERMFEFASFLASAARGSVDEGGLGASLRFLDALSQLPELGKDTYDDKFLVGMSKYVKKHMNIDFLVAREEYMELLDDVLARFGRQIRRRDGFDA